MRVQAGVYVVNVQRDSIDRVASPRDEASFRGPGDHGGYVADVWSPDGSRIAFTATNQQEGLFGTTDLVTDVFTVAADGSRLRQITDNGRSHSPAFRPSPDDGERPTAGKP